MSPSIKERVEQGAQQLIESAERMLQEMAAGPDVQKPFSVSNSVYYLPIALSYFAKPVDTIGELQTVVHQARALLAADAGLAALLAAEATETLCAIQHAMAQPTSDSVSIASPISDAQVRSWGIQLADGRMPGLALIMGFAHSNMAAAALIRELRRHNILCLLGGNAKARSMTGQLQGARMELDDKAYVVSLGDDPSSSAHALGFAARCGMKLGGHKPGTWTDILQHCRRRTPGFVLMLGEVDDTSWAIAQAAKAFGFSVIADRAVPEGEQVVAVPFETIDGEDEAQKAIRLVEECVSVRGLRLRQYSVSIPVAYGPAFEDQVVSDAELHIQLGGKEANGFELVHTADANEVMDGKVDLVGPDLPELDAQARADFGLVVKVAGKNLETDFEPYLERQIHSFIGYASGVQHTGSGDSVSIRISKRAVARGFRMEALGNILHARFHEEFPGAIEKIQVTIITDPTKQAAWRARAHDAHEQRNKYIASLRDSDVDEFYVCTSCRAFAPNNVSIITPERVSPCGKCNWLDAKAAYAINPGGVRRPIKVGKVIDSAKGIWEGTNNYARTASHGRLEQVALYSIMHTPMGACGDFECMVMLIPDANGVMVVAHNDTSLTPAGITIDTFSSLTAGEQIPGVVGVGKNHLLSPKFIAAEGGFKRVVWMSSVLKESMAEELKAVCAREGDPELLDRIADERQVRSVEQLLRWMREHRHPALEMERMF